MSTRSHIHRWLSSGLLEVTITSPTEAQVVTTAAPTISWTFSPGSQTNRRVRIYADALLTTLQHDSGVLGTSTQSYTVPAGSIFNGQTYYAIVDITTTTGIPGQSDVRSFSTSFVPSVQVTGLTTQMLGSGCNQVGAPTMLPRVRLRWTQVVPGGGETFVRYEIHRRIGGETAWTTIAHVAAVATVTYDDATAEPFEVYEYSVVWVATAAGFTLISNETSPPVQGYIEFDHIWLHDVDEIASSVRLHSFSVREDINQEQEYLRSWGRQREAVHIGSQQSASISIDGSALRAKDPIEWRKLQALLTRQRTSASVLCLRYGIPRMKYYVVLSTLGRSIGQGEQTQSITLREIQHEEAVSAE